MIDEINHIQKLLNKITKQRNAITMLQNLEGNLVILNRARKKQLKKYHCNALNPFKENRKGK